MRIGNIAWPACLPEEFYSFSALRWASSPRLFGGGWHFRGHGESE